MAAIRESVMDKVPAFTNYVQYKGVWDMEDLYQFINTYFSKRKYKFYETKYIVKHPSPFGPETYYVWKAEKKHNEYTKFALDIFVHTYDTQDVSVMMDNGDLNNFTRGRIWIQFRGHVQQDHEGRFDENAFFANLRAFYHNYVIYKKIQGVFWDDMYYNDFLKLHSLVKERLKMESLSFEHRNFNKVR